MELVFLKYAIITAVLCACVESQSGFYPALRINVARPSRPLPPHLPPPFSRKSEGECASGSSCMFLLLCLMGGGEAGPPCAGGLLSACCRMPPNLPRLPAQLPPSTHHEAAKTKELLKEKKEMNNVTYCGIARPKPQSRIIGGNDATYGEFPWQAHIKIKKQQCGGVLLSNYHVLTAAHCIYQVRLSDMSIQLGVFDIQDSTRQSSSPQNFRVVEKLVHPRFQYQAAHPDRFDVALLRLDRAARFGEHVTPICLPPAPPWDVEGRRGVITGWGKTDPGLSNRYGTRLLQKVEVPIISNAVCERWHHEKGIDITISPEMLCAGYEEGEKDACVGDSGGPLMVQAGGRWMVVGLVSAGFGCAQSKQPGIYHRVQHTVDWLRHNIS